MSQRGDEGPGAPDRGDSPVRGGATEGDRSQVLPGRIGAALPFDRAWCIEAEPGATAEAVESQLCLADGTVGSRAVLEEDRDPEVAPVLVADVYESADNAGESLMTASTWVVLPIVQGLPAGRRVLDLRDGLLTREAECDGGSFRSVRFACHDRPGTQVLVAEVSNALIADHALDGIAGATSDRKASALGGGMAVAGATALRTVPGSPDAVAIVRVVAFVGSPAELRAPRRLHAACGIR